MRYGGVSLWRVLILCVLAFIGVEIREAVKTLRLMQDNIASNATGSDMVEKLDEIHDAITEIIEKP